MNIKNKLAKKLLPITRAYIRYSPVKIGKSALFKRFEWRDFTYTKRTKFGALMSGRTADVVQGYIYYFGVWEPNLTAFISSRLKNNSARTFVDVGANVGYFSLLAASHLIRGHVVAIEAFPSIFQKLENNIKLNEHKNIRLLPYAVTDKRRDILMFHAGEGNEGATTSVAGKFESEPIRVPGNSLINLLTEDEIRNIKIIKIDVEGAEYSVVMGMAELIKSLPIDAEVVIEITPSAYSKGQLAEVFDIFKAAGFFPYCLENPYDPGYYIENSLPVRPTPLRELPTTQTDVVFSRISAEVLA
jgi:FkbM family methyltransferase